MFYISQNDSTLPNGKDEQNQRVLVTILTVNSENAKMQHSDPHYGEHHSVGHYAVLRFFCII